MPDPIETTSPASAASHGTCQLLDDMSSGVQPSAPSENTAGGGPPSPAPTAVLELRVRNHPGTMSHVTGLFARRGFNLEAIVCVPLDDGRESCMLLLVADEPRLEQVERQLAKLYDVLAVRHRPDLAPDLFRQFARITGGAAPVSAG